MMRVVAGFLARELAAIFEDEIKPLRQLGVKTRGEDERARTRGRAFAGFHGIEPVALPRRADRHVPFRARCFHQVITHTHAKREAMIQILERVAVILDVRDAHIEPARQEIVELPDEAVVLFHLLAVDFSVVAEVIEVKPRIGRAALNRGVNVHIGLARVACSEAEAGGKFARPLVHFPVAGGRDRQQVRARIKVRRRRGDDLHFVGRHQNRAVHGLEFLDPHTDKSRRTNGVDVLPIERQQIQLLAVELQPLVLQRFDVAFEPFAGLELDPVETVVARGRGRTPVIGGVHAHGERANQHQQAGETGHGVANVHGEGLVIRARTIERPAQLFQLKGEAEQ